MSVEPVTVTITTEEHDGAIQYGLARTKAAAELGLEPNEIVCLVVAPVGVTPASEILDPDTNKPVRAASFTFESTWAPQHIEPRAPKVDLIAWPVVDLPRGARWHGLIPTALPGVSVEATLISTGEKLVELDSDEGKAILETLKTPAAIT